MTLAFEPPGKGEWVALTDHFPRPLTAEYQRLIADGMAHGEAEAFERYGIPARTLAPAFVHGYLYISPVALVGKAANALPPLPLLWLAARLVPAFRRRNAAARRALAERTWLAEAERWYEVDRAAWITRNRVLDAVDPTALTDGELAEHLRTVRANATEGYRTHFSLHGTDLFPTALLLLRAQELGLDTGEVLDLLIGSSPASTGTSELPPWRLVTGYDLDSLAACELPPTAPRTQPTPLASVDCPPELDQLIADARATYGLRDDNGMLTAAWPVGLLRRAMLAAGARLGFGANAVEATSDELAALLESHPGPDVTEIDARHAARVAGAASPGPPTLGPTLGLPLAALPGPMRRMAQALLLVRDLGTTALEGRRPLHGVGVGSTPAIGRACVAIDPNEALARFEPGDVLVALGTTPAYNALLAVAAAVVTEEGGQLSHAAVMARELGIPAVIGAAGALAEIVDGSMIEVDPVAGRVRVVAAT